MPFLLLFTGILLLVVAIRNEQTPFVHLVASEFQGPGNFIYWVVALVMLGAIGYVPKAKPVVNMLIVLILLALILNRGNPATNRQTGGVFQQLWNALKTTNTPAGATGGGIVQQVVQQATGTGG